MLFNRLGFLKYYTEIFDWKQYVVSIRDNNLITRKSKGWHKTRLAIEDPFELSHNLAAGGNFYFIFLFHLQNFI